MKKVFLSALFVGSLACGAFAQGNGQIESIAKKALRDAGCIGGGNYNAEIVVTGTCTTNLGAILEYHEVDVYDPNNPGAPVGRVSICGTEPTVVECL